MLPRHERTTDTETRPSGSPSERTAHDPGNEQGSFLLDLMLGVAIFMLVLLISINLISQNRQRVYANAAMSDAQGLAVALEAEVTDGHDYPTVLATADVRSHGVHLSDGNRVGDYRINGGALRYCIEHADGSTADAYAAYAADLGGVVLHGRTGGCEGVLDRLDAPEDSGTPDPGPSTPPATTSPDPTPTQEPTTTPLYIADAFTGSGPLGITQEGGATWTYLNATASDFARGPGGVTITATPSANPMAVVEAAKSDVAVLAGTPTADTAIFFRVQDNKNYLRLRLTRTSKSGVVEPTIDWNCSFNMGTGVRYTTVTRDSSMTKAQVEAELKSASGGRYAYTCTAISPVTPKSMYAWKVYLDRVANGYSTNITYRSLPDTDTGVTTPLQQFGLIGKGTRVDVLMDGAVWQTFTLNYLLDATMHGVGATTGSSPAGASPSVTTFEVTDAP